MGWPEYEIALHETASPLECFFVYLAAKEEDNPRLAMAVQNLAHARRRGDVRRRLRVHESNVFVVHWAAMDAMPFAHGQLNKLPPCISTRRVTKRSP
jgi:hypothetical protein